MSKRKALRPPRPSLRSLMPKERAPLFECGPASPARQALHAELARLTRDWCQARGLVCPPQMQMGKRL